MTADALEPLIHVPARLRIVVTLAALRDLLGPTVDGSVGVLRPGE